MASYFGLPWRHLTVKLKNRHNWAKTFLKPHWKFSKNCSSLLLQLPEPGNILVIEITALPFVSFAIALVTSPAAQPSLLRLHFSHSTP